VFKKILVANRGEIALRIIRACRELGIASVAVHSTADTNALHTRFANESVCIGPPPARLSYLNVPALMSVAQITGADAIHPGYGFLAENADFAEVCERSGVRFIGPPAAVMRVMGDKVRARAAMAAAGVPILPGTGVLDDDAEAARAAAQIGYPVIIKAAAGGGGRGMKVVTGPADLPAQLATARAEAQAGFGNPDVFLERYIERPRHVEVQILADGAGHVACLGERECSVQRRHQKLIEEAPCPALTQAARDQLQARVAAAVRAVGYANVGTLEFLRDDAGHLSFMEMNTRIQVEHTVTEMVTGVDLVRAQIRQAAGYPLALPADIRPRGHAIECRINAEDPRTFAPSPGVISALNLPGGFGVRVDTHVYEQYRVPPHYDSLLAKLIVQAENRAAAIARLERALDEFVIEGVKTNLELHRRVVRHPDFVAGNLDTHLIERVLAGNDASARR
jgi:acetyl-CoA carboxylase, biotin carboxylase subunit